MGFLEWLEDSQLAEWASISLEGYPIIITAHSIGLAVMVGTVMMLDLRLLGCFKGIPYASLSRILRVAWIGFVINFLSGVVLFSMQATSYVTNPVFLVKISFIALGVLFAAQQQFVISKQANAWSESGVPGAVRAVAVISLVVWTGAIISGRLIAYL